MFDGMIEFGLMASRWLQTTYPQAAAAMQAVSDFGRIPTYLVFITLLYWCVNKRLGGQLAYLLILTGFLNSGLKQFFRQPRPFWLASDLSESGASGYGFPSGHVQSATVFAYFFAGWFREAWLWVLATLYAGTMALSRVYLGVHFVHDVAVGFVAGAMTLVGFALVQQFVAATFNRRLFGQRLLVMALLPIALLVAWGLAVLWLGSPVASTDGLQALTDSAELAQTAGVVQSLAMLFGFGVGLTFERSRVRFQSGGPIWQRTARFLAGSFGTVIIYFGLTTLIEQIVPLGATWLAIPLWGLQFILLGLWVSFYAPKLFVSLGLCDFSAEPELPYTVEATTIHKSSR